jgi:hypothetical protein
MSDIKISELPAAQSLTGDELIPVAQDGVTVSVSAEQLKTLAQTGMATTAQVNAKADATALAAATAQIEQAQGTANDALGDAATAQQKADLAQDTANEVAAALDTKADLVDGKVPAVQLPPATPDEPHVAYVQTSGDDATGAVGGKPFRTLQAAYAAVGDYDNVVYSDGTGFEWIEKVGSAWYAKNGNALLYSTNSLRWRLVSGVNLAQTTVGTYSYARQVLGGRMAVMLPVVQGYRMIVRRYLFDETGLLEISETNEIQTLGVAQGSGDADYCFGMVIAGDGNTFCMVTKTSGYALGNLTFNCTGLFNPLPNNNWGLSLKSNSYVEYGGYNYALSKDAIYYVSFPYFGSIPFVNSLSFDLTFEAYVTVAKVDYAIQTTGLSTLHIDLTNGYNLNLPDGAVVDSVYFNNATIYGGTFQYGDLLVANIYIASLDFSVEYLLDYNRENVNVYGQSQELNQYFFNGNQITPPAGVNLIELGGSHTYGSMQVLQSGLWDMVAGTYTPFVTKAPYNNMAGADGVLVSWNGSSLYVSLDGGATWEPNGTVALKLGVGDFALDLAAAPGGPQPWYTRIALAGSGRSLTRVALSGAGGTIPADNSLTLIVKSTQSAVTCTGAVLDYSQHNGTQNINLLTNCEIKGNVTTGMARSCHFQNNANLAQAYNTHVTGNLSVAVIARDCTGNNISGSGTGAQLESCVASGYIACNSASARVKQCVCETLNVSAADCEVINTEANNLNQLPNGSLTVRNSELGKVTASAANPGVTARYYNTHVRQLALNSGTLANSDAAKGHFLNGCTVESFTGTADNEVNGNPVVSFAGCTIPAGLLGQNGKVSSPADKNWASV